MVSITLFASLFVFLILNVPIGIALGVSSLTAILAGESLSPGYITQSLVAGCDSFPIMAIPLFILAGELMGAGGVSKRILDFCNVFFGRLTGGIAIVTVVVCMFFAAVSGSGPATVAAVGSMVVPSMLARGYSKSFTLALIASAGCIGVIIPPSIPMVIFGVSTSTSISDMFLGGFIPGVVIGFSMIAWCYFYCSKKGWKGDDIPFTWERARSVGWEAKWALINPLIILGGIYAGIFTPTEAAAVAVVYAFICGVVIHRELTLRTVVAPIASACSTTGTTMVILGCATAFTKILTVEQIPAMITQGIIEMTDSRVFIILLINLLLLIVGCFMDTTPAIIVLSPILLPVAEKIGLAPVHFGLIMVVNLAIGFVTPPLGINLFVATRLGNVPLEAVTRGIIPFIAIMIACLLIVSFVPPLVMFLPGITK